PPPEPKKSNIDPELLAEIKTELLRKKQELGSAVSSELDDMREAAEGHHLADMDDLGGDAHDEETQFKILEIEAAEIGQIDMALERIVAGTFGLCEQCEKPITADRLRALPFTNLCINCKRQQEANDR
ncbi:MAG: TraR/DksA family transcriptional regulator, partial [Planctomycetota bacterium]